MKIAIPYHALLAASHATATKDIRSYLECVHINKDRLQLEAADGHMLLSLALPTAEALDENILIPNNVVNQVLKAYKPKKHESKWLYLENKNGDDQWTLGDDGIKVAFTKPDAKYPNFGALFTQVNDSFVDPFTKESLAYRFDISIYKRIDKIEKALESFAIFGGTTDLSKGIKCAFRGLSLEQAVMVLMPMRVGIDGKSYRNDYKDLAEYLETQAKVSTALSRYTGYRK